MRIGETRRWAERVNLAEMTPHNDLASTKFCLANPGFEYLVYLPKGGTVTVDLSQARGEFAVEWQNAAIGKATNAGTVSGGARRELKPPFDGDAVLYILHGSRR
jgi:hypothetical protein